MLTHHIRAGHGHHDFELLPLESVFYQNLPFQMLKALHNIIKLGRRKEEQEVEIGNGGGGGGGGGG